jgi:hypothetical protein
MAMHSQKPGSNCCLAAHYRDIPEDQERLHIRLTLNVIEQVCGSCPD